MSANPRMPLSSLMTRRRCSFASTIRPAIVGPEFSQWERKGQGSAVGDPADPLFAPLSSNPTLEEALPCKILKCLQ